MAEDWDAILGGRNWRSSKFRPNQKWVFPKIMGKPPKSSVLIGFSIINHPFWGTPNFGNIQILPHETGLLEDHFTFEMALFFTEKNVSFREWNFRSILAKLSDSWFGIGSYWLFLFGKIHKRSWRFLRGPPPQCHVYPQEIRPC